MIVLNKKTIRIFALGVFAITLCLVCIDAQRDVVPTVSLPVSDKTIVIDARTWKTR